MPILTAARTAAGYATLSERANPIVERLIFMAVESSLRGRAAHGAGPEDVLRGLSGRVDAQWVSPPALALSHGNFLPWSPGSEAEVGRFALSRDWLRRGQEAAQGRGGRSRMADAVQAFGTASVLSSALLAETIGVSIRTALTLLGEMTNLGLMQEITGRQTARIWAAPRLGARVAARPARGARRKGGHKFLGLRSREHPGSAILKDGRRTRGRWSVFSRISMSPSDARMRFSSAFDTKTPPVMSRPATSRCQAGPSIPEASWRLDLPVPMFP